MVVGGKWLEEQIGAIGVFFRLTFEIGRSTFDVLLRYRSVPFALRARVTFDILVFGGVVLLLSHEKNHFIYIPYRDILRMQQFRPGDDSTARHVLQRHGLVFPA